MKSRDSYLTNPVAVRPLRNQSTSWRKQHMQNSIGKKNKQEDQLATFLLALIIIFNLL